MKTLIASIALFLAIISTASAEHLKIYVAHCAVKDKPYMAKISSVEVYDNSGLVKTFTPLEVKNGNLEQWMKDNVEDWENHMFSTYKAVTGYCKEPI